MELKKYLEEKRDQVENSLERFMLEAHGLLSDHIEAMQYSLFAGGKRVRPILCIAAAEALGKDPEPFLPIACALECIHTYSLIHDDLPAMDNDDYRRGKFTNHKVFGEAEAILAGDGLLTFAFELMTSPDLSDHMPDSDRLRLVNLVARAAGPIGMVGGQAIDLASEGKKIPFDTLRFLHSHKTGALITVSVQAGAIIAKASRDEFEAFTRYGKNLGLAFQIVDDLLNVEGSSKELGKATGSDAARGKATYPAFFGLEETRTRASDAVNSALRALALFDAHADPLRELARYILARKK